MLLKQFKEVFKTTPTLDKSYHLPFNLWIAVLFYLNKLIKFTKKIENTVSLADYYKKKR